MPRDEKGRTPLDMAESSEMITLLKKHGLQSVDTPIAGSTARQERAGMAITKLNDAADE